MVKNSRGVMLKELWILGAPTIVEQLLQTMVGYVDTAMVGRLGAKASAAVGVTATVNWLFYGMMFAASLGLLSYIARFTGAGDEKSARRASAQGIWLLLFLGIPENILALAISPVLPIWLGAAEEIQEDASMYFFLVSLAMFFRCSMIVFGNVLRANKDTRTPMKVNILVNLLNIVLNQLLIGGTVVLKAGSLRIPVPGMGLGIAGAAIATALSLALGGILLFAAAMQSPKSTLRGQPIRPDQKILRSVFSVSLPLMGERLIIGSGYVMFTTIVASLGTVATAAHTIALQVEEAFYIPGYGVQTAVSTLAGNALGERSLSKLSQVVKAGLSFAVSIMALMAAGLFWKADWIMAIFTRDSQVVSLGASVLRIVAVSEPLFAAFIILEGTFHGIGETKLPVMIGLFTMWGIRIGLSWCLVHWLHVGLQTVWVCMIMDNITRCLLLAVLYRWGKWKNKLFL